MQGYFAQATYYLMMGITSITTSLAPSFVSFFVKAEKKNLTDVVGYTVWKILRERLKHCICLHLLHTFLHVYT